MACLHCIHCCPPPPPHTYSPLQSRCWIPGNQLNPIHINATSPTPHPPADCNGPVVAAGAPPTRFPSNRRLVLEFIMHTAVTARNCPPLAEVTTEGVPTCEFT
eukprot:GGOE01006275.1.p5 GENE.GGOE01006275.1~~GGOE01006275.1.p5  ORF type:complete len:103 (-),score=6.78 GGOE01006275.1:618-926(-)